eukprot:TRINITY_DN516_c0_g2_i2.p1 TRINITY_DN516_c0_g2~~TRINITY_DN516_c0_g2_i2.p1  ORF type:complete len:701 (+),score=254.01 TRINITY_DN516_c0_g2_i2:217-2103(+)
MLDDDPGAHGSSNYYNNARTVRRVEVDDNGNRNNYNNNNNNNNNNRRGGGGRGNRNNPNYPDYLPEQEIKEGLENGTLFHGLLRVNAQSTDMAYVTIKWLGRDVLIRGERQNRAFPLDDVVIRIDPVDEWQSDSITEEWVEPEEPEEGASSSSSSTSTTSTVEGYKDDEEAIKDFEKEEVNPFEGLTVRQRNALRATGEVVGFVNAKHLDREFIGSFSTPRDGLRTVEFISMDSRDPRFRIPINSCPEELFQDPKYFSKVICAVKFLRWSKDSRSPFAEFIAAIGQAGTVESETMALLRENGIEDVQFSDDVLNCLPQENPWEIPQEEYEKRKDFRDLRIFSIDPETARDLDDALSIEELENGNYKVGVHIADVTYFVTPGNPLDEEARARATSTYLVQRVIPMLPRMLCENLCSLNGGVERLAYSVQWEMTPQGGVRSVWFGRSIIKSVGKLAYGDAQKVIEGEEGAIENLKSKIQVDNVEPEDVAKDLMNLHGLAVQMRKHRFENGSVRLDNPKYWFELDPETGKPIDMHIYKQKDSNFLVEEFMLLANRSVAKKLAKTFPDSALLRSHPPPLDNKVANFLDFCKHLKIHDFKWDDSASLHRSLLAVAEKYKDDKDSIIPQIVTYD